MRHPGLAGCWAQLKAIALLTCRLRDNTVTNGFHAEDLLKGGSPL